MMGISKPLTVRMERVVLLAPHLGPDPTGWR